MTGFPENPAEDCDERPYPVVTAMNFINSNATSSPLRPGGAGGVLSEVPVVDVAGSGMRDGFLRVLKL